MAAKPPKVDAGKDAASYYETVPTSKDGEFAHAQAQVADLNQTGSTEMRRTNDGVAPK